MKAFVSVIRHFSGDRQKKRMCFHMKIHLCGQGLTTFLWEVHLSIVSALEYEWRQEEELHYCKIDALVSSVN